MKNIVVVIGSPRKNGNTEILANAFINGAREAGNNVNVISVNGQKIGGCTGCNYCYKNAQHNCVQNDGMTQIYAQLALADIIVFATPVYFYGVSSQLKCLIDRLHNPIRNSFAVKKLALLAVCADKEESVFDSVIAMYQSVLKYFSLANGGIITVHSVVEKGDINSNPKLIDAYNLGKSI